MLKRIANLKGALSPIFRIAIVSRGFWLSKRVLIFEMPGRCAKVNDTAGALLNEETVGKSFGEHSNLLCGTCYGIPKVLDRCNSSAIVKAERFRNKTGTRKLFNRRLHTYTVASYRNLKLSSGNSKLYNVRASFYMLRVC